MREYRWRPIEPLSDRDRAIDLAATRALYASWHAARSQLRETGPEGVKEFTQRLVRRLGIETGILERIYDLDRGTTEVLVAAGFREDLVSRSSTDLEPAQLIDILRAQEAAIQMVMDGIGTHQELTKGFLHRLHATLTRHQDTTVAVDQFGKRFEVPLERGHFKTMPNNPSRGDGVITNIVHHYRWTRKLSSFLSG